MKAPDHHFGPILLPYNYKKRHRKKLLKAGWKLHHEREWCRVTGELMRDDWYAADPWWVQDYLDSGGQWAYRSEP